MIHANNYLVNLEWVADGHSLLIEQMNRLQNQRTLWRVDAETGQAEQLFQDRDDAWVDVRARFDWFQSDTHRLLLSEQDGWQHAYLVSLADGSVRQVTRGEFDVVELCGLDQDRGWLYFTASPCDPIRRYLYRVSLDGTSEPQRVTPAGVTGTHSYDVAPNGHWAVHTHSTLQSPPVINLVRLPSHETMRTLEANDDVRAKVNALQRGELEFFRVTIQDEQEQSFPVDGWMIKPPDLDVTRKYPVLFYVYTEPWGQTARDMWGGDRYLWHVLLSQQGYLVATLDNRGTPAPRGRAWRKSIYRKIGIVNVRDQAAGTRQVLQRPYVDADRVAVWGWSGGGTMTLNAMFQHPSLYHVGMAVAPVGDERLYDTVYQERYMGLPDDNEEGYREGSAITHAKNLTGKLLIVHGTGDDNVHYQNAEVVINELIRHNRPFDMMSYPNRTHSIREGENTSLHLAELLTRYLTTHLPAGPR